ncbi:MAG: STAS domain-containing protein [Deferribacterales bacterium]
MKITVDDKGSAKVIRPYGKIDILTSSELRSTLSELTKKKVMKVIVDLAQVTYLDSSGLATLLEALKNLKEYEGKLQLANVPDRILKVMSLMKLDLIFEIIEDNTI